MPAASKIPDATCYHDLIADKPGTLKWPDFGEKTASSLCYTGTTGNPKGVLYSPLDRHPFVMMMLRVPVLRQPGRRRLLVVPILPPILGLVYRHDLRRQADIPGPKLDGASIYELSTRSRSPCRPACCVVHGVALLDYAQSKPDVSAVKRSLIGGSAVPTP